MAISFTKFKDRIWFIFEAASKALANRSKFVQDLSYGLLHGLLMLLYFIPSLPLRQTSVAFGAVLGIGPPRKLHSAFSRRAALALRRMQAMRYAPIKATDALLNIPEQDRLDGLLDTGGAVLVMPHCHASVVMVRGLAARYPTLMLARTPRNDRRAASQLSYYEKLNCDVLDVRRNEDGQVARAVFKALRQGKIVIGVVDSVYKAPDAATPIDKASDAVRVSAFGEPIGLAGWPARFSKKCKVPILPVMVEQTPAAINLHLGDVLVADDVVDTTQSWWRVMEGLIRRYPSDWLFLYDKHWANLLMRVSKPD